MGHLSPWARLLLAAATIIALTAVAFFLPPAKPAAAQNGVCDRTQTVAAHLMQRSGVNNCAEVTDAHLAAITQLDLSN